MAACQNRGECRSGIETWRLYQARQITLPDLVTVSERWGEGRREALEYAAAGRRGIGYSAIPAAALKDPYDTSPGESHPDRTTHMQAITVELHEPVSAKIINQAGRHRAAINRVLAAIDKVHVDGPLHPIPLTTSSQIRDDGVFDVDRKSGRGESITIRRGADRPALVVIHEVAHFLDHDALGDRGGYASERDAIDTFEVMCHILYNGEAFDDLFRRKGWLK